MQTLSINGYEMAYLDVGQGPPLVCVHGTLGDFRTWSAVLGPLSKTRRVISISLRHFFPEHWDGTGQDYLIAQHVSDVIGFIQKLDARPVDLMGHSRGGHICFRVAEQRPELLRKLILAEPGGELDQSLDPSAGSSLSPRAVSFAVSAEKIREHDIEGGLKAFFDMIEGDGAWARLPAAPKQQLRDNAYTLIGAGRRKSPALQTDRSGITQDPDAVRRRRRHQRRLAARVARWPRMFPARRRQPYLAPVIGCSNRRPRNFAK
jgi:pimeloyl-ACP methyl ester carboxylesterase